MSKDNDKFWSFIRFPHFPRELPPNVILGAMKLLLLQFPNAELLKSKQYETMHLAPSLSQGLVANSNLNPCSKT